VIYNNVELDSLFGYYVLDLTGSVKTLKGAEQLRAELPQD